MRARTVQLTFALLLLGVVSSGECAARQVSVGTQANWGSDADFGVGGRAVFDLGRLVRGLETHAAFDWFFPGPDLGVDVTYWEANANVVYRFGGDAPVTGYAGTGLNLARFAASTKALGTEVAGKETKGGLNALGGLQLQLRGLRPFLEGRFELGGGEQFVVAIGLRT